MSQPNDNRYSRILAGVFKKHYKPGDLVVPFTRTDLKDVAQELGVRDPDNWGDNLYTFRFRTPLPAPIMETAPTGREWAIFLAGRSRYEFRVVTRARFTPTQGLAVTKIPDATPELVTKTALTDEQALLALIRYNRLIDLFIGGTAYSLQNHLRTTAPSIGQTEIDEVYVVVDKYGVQYVVPVQAKVGTDQIGVVQVVQDLAVCEAKFHDLVARPVAAKFMAGGTVALFEFMQDDSGDVVIANEKHYRLVSADDISATELEQYRRAARAGN